MVNEMELSPQELKMQAILNGYLSARKENEPSGPHLDADSIAAFTEGRLSEREAKPLVTHMVDCSFCRRVTADIVRLDAVLADMPAPAAVNEAREPARISDVLSNLFSKIFGSGDSAVFAHHEEESEEKEEDPPTDEDK